MPRGYMEGPASEEAERRAEELEHGIVHEEAAPASPAVYGCTANDPEPHFIGWLNEVDPDAGADDAFGRVAERQGVVRPGPGVRRAPYN